MRLTTFTDYSLRVLVYLALEPGRRATIAGIASAFGVSEHHLVKVVHHLGRQGWLRNVRGKGGGLELGKAPADIRIGELVRDTEQACMAECFADGSGNCAIGAVCGLRGMLGEAVQAFHAVLDRYTLQDAIGNRAQLVQALAFDRSRVRTKETG